MDLFLFTFVTVATLSSLLLV